MVIPLLLGHNIIHLGGENHVVLRFTRLILLRLRLYILIVLRCVNLPMGEQLASLLRLRLLGVMLHQFLNQLLLVKVLVHQDDLKVLVVCWHDDTAGRDLDLTIVQNEIRILVKFLLRLRCDLPLLGIDSDLDTQ
jgi:uncharacterized SAM-binding protein YcdF (DUF218 family)